MVPFCILVFQKNREKPLLVNIACALVVLGVFCKRVWLLFTAFITPNLMGAPGLISGSSEAIRETGTASFAVLSSYAPTVFEVLIVVGVLALVVLAFLLLAGLLLKPGKPKASE